MVICFYKEQAGFWRTGKVTTFQVDMNYKHISENQEKEIVVAWWDAESNQCK
jgi:hypothetical protein